MPDIYLHNNSRVRDFKSKIFKVKYQHYFKDHIIDRNIIKIPFLDFQSIAHHCDTDR